MFHQRGQERIRKLDDSIVVQGQHFHLALQGLVAEFSADAEARVVDEQTYFEISIAQLLSEALSRPQGSKVKFECFREN